MEKPFTKKKLKAPVRPHADLVIELPSATASPTPLDPPNNDSLGQLPVDILENDREILIMTPVAGMDLDRTEVVITNDVLTIRGTRENHAQAFGFSGKNTFRQECYWGAFSRSVLLPANVDTSLIEATQENHVLYIRIPKQRRVNMRIVKIK